VSQITNPALVIISLEIVSTQIILLHAYLQVVFCVVSSVSVHPQRTNCTYKTYGQTKGQTG